MFDGFVYQVICNGQQVVVLCTEPVAQAYVTEHLKGCEALILPVAVFDYTESGGEEE